LDGSTYTPRGEPEVLVHHPVLLAWDDKKLPQGPQRRPQRPGQAQQPPVQAHPGTASEKALSCTLPAAGRVAGSPAVCLGALPASRVPWNKVTPLSSGGQAAQRLWRLHPAMAESIDTGQGRLCFARTPGGCPLCLLRRCRWTAPSVEGACSLTRGPRLRMRAVSGKSVHLRCPLVALTLDRIPHVALHLPSTVSVVDRQRLSRRFPDMAIASCASKTRRP